MTGRRDEAEDLTQEVFLRTVRALDSYQPREREAAWLFRIARNVFLNHRRSARRQALESELPDVVAGGPEPLLGIALSRALEALDETDREVLLLSQQAGLTYHEVAQACGLTVEAVRARIYRARNALRAALGPELAAVRSGNRKVSHD